MHPTCAGRSIPKVWSSTVTVTGNIPTVIVEGEFGTAGHGPHTKDTTGFCTNPRTGR